MNAISQTEPIKIQDKWCYTSDGIKEVIKLQIQRDYCDSLNTLLNSEINIANQKLEYKDSIISNTIQILKNTEKQSEIKDEIINNKDKIIRAQKKKMFAQKIQYIAGYTATVGLAVTTVYLIVKTKK